LALLRSTDGSVLALLGLPSIFSCHNSTVGEFWCTMVFMQEKQENFLFEIECSIFLLTITWKSKDIPVVGFPDIGAPLSLFFRGSS
jgi:hypothetical protein